MKLDGFLKGTGKIGSIVTSRVAGVTIAREYNPNVANPNTQAQVNQRARFKLLAQLAAVFGSTSVIPKQGLRTKRSQFMAANANVVYANSGEAQATLENLQLTSSAVALPAIQIGQRSVEVETFDVMLDGMARNLTAVVYNCYQKTDDGNLVFQVSAVADEPSDGYLWPAKMPYVDGEVLILAYGIIASDEGKAALAKYGEMSVLTGEDVARLVASTIVSSADLRFTQTRGAMQDAEGNAIDPESATKVRVFATASPSQGGSVSGAGKYDRGGSVTLTATPASGYSFVEWRNNGTTDRVSGANPYTISNLQNTIDLVAVFVSSGGGSLNPD